MRSAQLGDRVTIRYAQVRRSGNKSTKPPRIRTAEFTVGTRDIIAALSTGVVGMLQGEQKRFTLQPNEAYGPIRPKLIREIPRQRFPKQLTLRIGQRLTATQGGAGPRRRITVTEIKPDSVVVDGNHPLAGKVVQIDVLLITVDSSSNANKTKQQ